MVGQTYTCFDCINSHNVPGFRGSLYEPPYEPESLCQKDVINLSDDDYNAMSEDGDYNRIARKCDSFSPRILGKCHICSSDIGQPVWSWQLWGNTYHGDSFPVCSEKCKEEAKLIYLRDRDLSCDY